MTHKGERETNHEKYYYKWAIRSYEVRKYPIHKEWLLYLGLMETYDFSERW